MRGAPVFRALYAVGAFTVWGLTPIYYKAVDHVGPLEVLAHRIVWSVVLLGALHLTGRKMRAGIRLVFRRSNLAFLVMTTLLISANWLLVIWAAQEGHVLEMSLGFFINPLVNVALGVLFLGEQLNWKQGVAIGLAFAGVLNLVIVHGTLSWISLAIALTFGFYGLIRKKMTLPSLPGLLFETLLMMPPAIIFMGFLSARGMLAYGHLDLHTDALLCLAGVVSVVPLILFLEGAKRLRLTTIGLVQYIAPSLNFLLAVLIYDEPFTGAHQVTFALIWIGLAIYSLDAIQGMSRRSSALERSRW